MIGMIKFTKRKKIKKEINTHWMIRFTEKKGERSA